MALLVREFQRRSENRRRSVEDLDARVTRAVDAGLGKSLLELRELESPARSSLSEAAASAHKVEAQLVGLLSNATENSSRLESLIAAAAELVPGIESARTRASGSSG